MFIYIHLIVDFYHCIFKFVTSYLEGWTMHSMHNTKDTSRKPVTICTLCWITYNHIYVFRWWHVLTKTGKCNIYPRGQNNVHILIVFDTWARFVTFSLFPFPNGDTGLDMFGLVVFGCVWLFYFIIFYCFFFNVSSCFIIVYLCSNMITIW